MAALEISYGRTAWWPRDGCAQCSRYAYAMWISPAFHLTAIRAFDAMMTGRAKAAGAHARTERDYCSAGVQISPMIEDASASLTRDHGVF